MGFSLKKLARGVKKAAKTSLGKAVVKTLMHATPIGRGVLAVQKAAGILKSTGVIPKRAALRAAVAPQNVTPAEVGITAKAMSFDPAAKLDAGPFGGRQRRKRAPRIVSAARSPVKKGRSTPKKKKAAGGPTRSQRVYAAWKAAGKPGKFFDWAKTEGKKVA